MGSSLVSVFHSSFEKQIIETNNEINVAIINIKIRHAVIGWRLTLTANASHTRLEGAFQKSHGAECRRFPFPHLLRTHLLVSP